MDAEPPDATSPTNVISPWLAADRAAIYLGGISVGSLVELPIPFSKVGKKRIYRIDDLDAYALSKRHGEAIIAPAPPAPPAPVAPQPPLLRRNPPAAASTSTRNAPVAPPASIGKRKRSAADWTRAVIARRR